MHAPARRHRRQPLYLAIALALPTAVMAQTYPSAVIVSGSNLDYEQYFKGSVVPTGLIQGSVTIHPVSPYPSQLGGAGVSVFDGATVTIDPTAGTPGPIRITSDYQSGAPNDALYIAYGTVHVVDSPDRVWLTGNGQTVHGVYMPEATAGPSLLDGGGITIVTTGISADGIRMYGSRSTVDIANTDITVNGGNGIYNSTTDQRSWGLLGWGGSNATLTNTSITGLDPTTGGGVRVINGASATLNGNSAVTTTYGAGLLAEAGAFIGTNTDAATAGTVTVNTTGASAHGVRIANSTGNLNRLSISTAANATYGLHISGTSTVSGSQVQIGTQGTSGYGIWTAGSSSLNLTGGAITTQGTTAYGLLAGSGAATVNLTDFAIGTHGDRAYGIYAWTGSTTNFSGGSISTDKDSTYGIYANAGTANLLRNAAGGGTSITTTGANAYAVRIQNGGRFTATGATLHAASAGIVFDAPQVLGTTPLVGATPGVPPMPPTTPEQPPGDPPPAPVIATVDPTAPTELGSDVPPAPAASATRIGLAPMALAATPLATGPYNMVLDGTTVVSDTSAALWIFGGIANVDLRDSTLTGPAAINATTRSGLAATATIDADHAVLDGRVYTDAASTLALNLSNDSLWNVTSNSNLTDLTNTASLIDFPVTPALTAAPEDVASYRSIRLTGDYVGNGGTIVFNTWVAGDDSPSDKLIIDGGSASGHTLVQIRNSGGSGEETTANGILVVETLNNGTTTTDAFALGSELRVGAYSYALLRGAIDNSSADSWYLRSEFVVPPVTPPPPPPPPPPPGPPPPPPPPPAPAPEPETELPVDPPPEPLPPGTYPIIGPELATYSAVQPTARQMGLATLGTLHERIGDTLTTANAQGSPSGPARSAWARAFGQDIDNRYLSYSDPRTDGQLFGAQVGVDLWQHGEADTHRDAAGAYVAYARSDVQVEGLVTNDSLTGYALVHTGQARLTGKSAGLYWTHYGPAGWYLDGVAQWTRYSGRATTQYANIDTDGHGWAVSMEAGYPIALSWGPSFVLEPQAQVIWQRVDFDATADAYGDVALGATSGSSARLGVRGQWTITRDDGEIWQPYVRANLWRDFNGSATTVYADMDRVPLEVKTTRVDASAGVTARLSDTVSIYGQIGYQTGVESGHQQRDGVFGDVGIRYRW